MKTITFDFHLVGMNDAMFSDDIMISKPRITLTFNLFEDEWADHEIERVSELISYIVSENPCAKLLLGEDGMRGLTSDNICILNVGCMLRTAQDRFLRDMFSFFHTKHLHFAYFFIEGGASFECDGYKFVVHSNEMIHRNSPHVHVNKNGYSVRYSLITLKRYKEDKCDRIYDRDEKRIIQPALKKHHKILWKFWKLSVNGYVPPEIDEKGRRYYEES